MRTLLIHQAFASPNQAGGTRHFELARLAAHRGHSFTVVASGVSYLTGARTSAAESAKAEGVRVLFAPALSSIHRNFVWRVLAFIYFMLSSLWVALRAGPVEVVMGTSPPIFQALTAWAAARLRKRPFLLEVRDLWPEFAIDMGVLKNPLLIGLSRGLERFLLKAADHILVNSPAYRDHFMAMGIGPDKISLIPNGVDPDMFHPDDRGQALRRELGLEDKFVVTYAGAMGPANDLGTALDAARLLIDDPRIHFLLVGAGKDLAALRARAARQGLSNVTFTGALAKSRMPEVLAASDACLAILADIPMFKTTYPNKVFDYMAAGRPTALAIDGVIRQVVEQAGGGVFVAPGDPAALARAVRNLAGDPDTARDMGQAARAYVVEHFNRAEQSARLADLLERLARRGRRPGGLLLKRALDLTAACCGLIIGSPLMLIIYLLVRWRLGSPAIFRQERPGRHGKPFTLYKFRTMTDQRGPDGELLPDDRRLTRLGRFLRATSLDELPELVNVLKGEMSLVGPRPLLMEYLPLYSPRQARRHEVKPGLTGWAQVNGRNILGWEEKFEHDVWYVDNRSLLLDLKIMGLTILRVAQGRGVNQPGQATAEKFTGEG